MSIGPPAPDEDTFVRKVWGDIWPNLAGLLAANCLFLVFCAPYGVLALLGLPFWALAVAPLTIGPGIVGLMTYCARLAEGKAASFWRDSLAGARASFVPGAVFVGITCVALAAQTVAAAIAREDGGSVTRWLWAGQVSILLCLALLHVHTFSLVALYGQRMWQAVRNAFILSFGHPLASLAMLSLFVITYVLVQFFGWGPLIIAPAIVAVFLVNTTMMLVARHGGMA